MAVSWSWSRLNGLKEKQVPLILWILLGLFVLRVLGQLLVANGLAPWLPPMHEWQSGLLPYPLLVVCQILIVLLFTKVCLDLSYHKGTFYKVRTQISNRVKLFGHVYFLAMIVRYVVYMMMVPEARWLHGSIPIFFHLVLASFLITYGSSSKEVQT